MEDNSKHFVIRTYKTLRRLGLVRNTYEYSEDWLNKSKDYYNVLVYDNKNEDRRGVSLTTLGSLSKSLRNKKEELERDYVHHIGEVNTLNLLSESSYKLLYEKTQFIIPDWNVVFI